jgi:WD40 repeat protein
MQANRVFVVFFPLAVFCLFGPANGAAPPAGTDRSLFDLYGDPLPPGALARVGTVRFRHGGCVQCVAFTGEGKTVLSGGDDHAIRLFNASTGQETRSFIGHRNSVMAISVAPGERLLASCTQGGHVRVWDFVTGKQLRQMGAFDPIYDVAFSRDGKWLACAETGVRIWSTDTWRQTHPLRGPHKRVFCLAFSCDSKALASGDEDGILRFWDAKRGNQVREVKAHDGAVRALAFSRDGQYLASTASDGTLRLWEAVTGKAIAVLCKRRTKDCSRLAFSPDGKVLAWQGDAKESIRLLAVPSGKELRTLTGHLQDVFCVSFSPDGKRLVSGSMDGTVRVWDVASGNEVTPRRYPECAIVAAVSPDGTLLATGGLDPEIRLWAAERGNEVGRLSDASGWFSAVAFSTDGKRLLAVRERTRSLWDVPARKRISSIKLDAQGYCTGVSPNQSIVVFQGRTGVHLIDAETGAARRLFEGWAGRVAFSSDGKQLAIGARGHVHLLEVASGKLLRTFPWPEASVLGHALSPDGRLLAAGAFVRNVSNEGGHRLNVTRLYGVSDGRVRHSMAGHPGGDYRMVFSPDGRTLATAGQDGLIRLWETCTGQERMTFTGHRAGGGVVSIAFFSDGKRLVSSGMDTTALIWDLTGRASRKVRDRLDVKALAALWDDLMVADGTKAYSAVQDLAAAPGDALPYLQKHLVPVVAPGARRLSRLIVELDSDEAAVRKQAYAALEELGELAGPAIREASQRPASAEVARSLKRLLAIVDQEEKAPTGERLRLIRALEVLERAGTPAARTLLSRLAKGAPQARITRDAKASLARLDKQAASKK